MTHEIMCDCTTGCKRCGRTIQEATHYIDLVPLIPLVKEIDLYGDSIGKVQYIQHVGTDKTVVNSARVSFGQDNDEALKKKDKKLIKYLIKHRHTSTLEHNTVTFKFTVPLYIRSQHHRHRTWSYNEISRRYTDVNIQFYKPKEFRTQHDSNRQASNVDELSDPQISLGMGTTLASSIYKSTNAMCFENYELLLKAGVCREQARGILPQNMYTEYYGTVNLNNLLKFIDLRIHEGAQWEIVMVAKACLRIAEDLWPETIAAYKEVRGVEW